MMLGQMRPSFAGQYAIDLRLSDAELRRNLPLGRGAVKLAYLPDLILSQFRAAMSGASARNAEAGAIGVRPILGTCAPFEIVKTVVRLASIFVVNLVMRGWRRTNECFGDKPMHKCGFVFPTLEKSGPDVAAMIITRRESDHVPLNGPDTSRVRYLIFTLKSNNPTPFYHYAVPSMLDTLPCNIDGVHLQQVSQGDIQ